MQSSMIKYLFAFIDVLRLKNRKEKKKEQDMTVPFARARAKLGGSIR